MHWEPPSSGQERPPSSLVSSTCEFGAAPGLLDLGGSSTFPTLSGGQSFSECWPNLFRNRGRPLSEWVAKYYRCAQPRAPSRAHVCQTMAAGRPHQPMLRVSCSPVHACSGQRSVVEPSSTPRLRVPRSHGHIDPPSVCLAYGAGAKGRSSCWWVAVALRVALPSAGAEGSAAPRLSTALRVERFLLRRTRRRRMLVCVGWSQCQFPLRRRTDLQEVPLDPAPSLP